LVAAENDPHPCILGYAAVVRGVVPVVVVVEAVDMWTAVPPAHISTASGSVSWLRARAPVMLGAQMAGTGQAVSPWVLEAVGELGRPVPLPHQSPNSCLGPGARIGKAGCVWEQCIARRLDGAGIVCRG
jgi:hypothetical protein